MRAAPLGFLRRVEQRSRIAQNGSAQNRSAQNTWPVTIYMARHDQTLGARVELSLGSCAAGRGEL